MCIGSERAVREHELESEVHERPCVVLGFLIGDSLQLSELFSDQHFYGA